VISLLGMPPDQLLLAVRYLAPNGATYSGANALVALSREFWWARPLTWMSRIPGFMRLMHAGYSWVARHRKCHAATCEHRIVARV
jgi:hypothetical protein